MQARAIAGMSAQGSFSAMGEGIAEIVRRTYPGSALGYEPSTTAGNVRMIAQGERAFAFIAPGELVLAARGAFPFDRAYRVEEFQVVCRVVEGFALQLVAAEKFLAEHGVATFAEIMERGLPVRMSVGARGDILARAMFDHILGYFGATAQTIAARGGALYYLPTRAGVDMMRNGRLDVVGSAGMVPNGRLIELSTGTRVRMLALPEALTASMQRTLDTDTLVIPADAYGFLETDLRTPSVAYLLVASRTASAADAYKIVKALYRHFDDYRRLHPMLNHLERSMLADTGRFHVHPGARAFFAEVGLLTSR